MALQRSSELPLANRYFIKFCSLLIIAILVSEECCIRIARFHII